VPIGDINRENDAFLRCEVVGKTNEGRSHVADDPQRTSTWVFT